MKQLLLAGTILAAMGVTPALSAVTATFCGPDSEGGSCEGPNEVKVFLDADKATMQGFGQIGGNHAIPTMSLASDGGMLNVSIDLANGFGTITPAQGQIDFNGLDITIPGYTFTDIAFDVQLTPVSGQTTDSFTISTFSGAHVSDGVGMESDAPDTDKQFSATAVGGAFDEVNVNSLTGFDEIKHIEISGLAAVPEPSTWAMLITGFVLMGLSAPFRKTKRFAL